MKIYPITGPRGSDTYVQYNNGGIFGGDAELKAVGVKTFNAIKQIVAFFDDPDIKQFMDWRP